MFQKNFVNKDPSKRKKGHRAIHLVFSFEFNNEVYPFEVQLMTLLQNAWDRKDHHIVYEARRKGEDVPLDIKMKSYAMSETYLLSMSFSTQFL